LRWQNLSAAHKIIGKENVVRGGKDIKDKDSDNRSAKPSFIVRGRRRVLAVALLLFLLELLYEAHRVSCYTETLARKAESFLGGRLDAYGIELHIKRE